MKEEFTPENIKKHFEEDDGFAKYNNLHIEELSIEKTVITHESNKHSLNPHGIIHGGLLYTMADSAMGTCAFLTGRRVVTVDCSINYLKPCRGPKVTCVASPVKLGETIAVYRAEIYNERDDLAATATGTFFFLDREINKK